MRCHGYTGWLYEGNGALRASYAGFFERSLCVQGGLDLYDIPEQQDAGDPVYFLSDFVGADGVGASWLFPAGLSASAFQGKEEQFEKRLKRMFDYDMMSAKE